jgi:serine/threonine protein phosphatase PrpC
MGIWNRFLRRDNPRGKTAEVESRLAKPFKGQGADLLQIGQGSDIGRAREHNEDAFLTLKTLMGPEGSNSPLAILAVADGLGGHARGEEASSTAVRVASGALVKEFVLPVLSNRLADDGIRPIQEILTEATLSANRAVSRMESDAGTTLTSVLITGHSAYVAHVGDTRAYYLADNKVDQITEDHSLVRRLLDLGEISPQEARSHPQRNLLYKALGQDPELEVDTYFRRLAKGSWLLVCSDGLWNNVSENKISAVVGAAPTPQAACDELIELANDDGGEDNITVVLAGINY